MDILNILIIISISGFFAILRRRTEPYFYFIAANIKVAMNSTAHQPATRQIAYIRSHQHLPIRSAAA
jgi:hypothetical protein